MLLNKHENDDIHTLHCTIHNQHILEPMHCSVSDIRCAFRRETVNQHGEHAEREWQATWAVVGGGML